MPFRRPNRKTWSIEVRTPGGVVRRTTGTSDRATAKAMERVVQDLTQRREWDLLNAVIDNRLSLGELFDANSRRRLSELRARLDDVDLEPQVSEWLDSYGDSVKADTVNHYRVAVRSLIAAGARFPRSKFTTAVIDKWIAARPGSSGTRLKALTAMSQFAKFLRRRGLLSANPVDGVERPRAAAPRTRFLTPADLVRLAEAHQEPFRTLSALLAGTGIEISVTLRLTRSDVDFAHREIRAAGTKTYARDRVVRVAEWAWPYVEQHCRALSADSLLFPGIDRWDAGDAHRDACVKTGIAGYTMRDHRHSFAVRAVRAGTPVEIVSRQLGHANPVLTLKVYSRFAPQMAERDRWERLAAAQDGLSALGEGSESGTLYHPLYHSDSHKNENRVTHSDYATSDSRGGTRTRDPGIMSAVL
jgi:integrase